jgi:hypothetical protein
MSDFYPCNGLKNATDIAYHFIPIHQSSSEQGANKRSIGLRMFHRSRPLSRTKADITTNKQYKFQGHITARREMLHKDRRVNYGVIDT